MPEKTGRVPVRFRRHLWFSRVRARIQTRSRIVNSRGAEGGKEARLAPVEALGVQRIGELEERVVEVMTELVQQRAEEGLVRHHLPAFVGEHPDQDRVPPTPVSRDVQPVQLAAARGRPPQLDPYRDATHAELATDAVGDAL